MSAVSKAPDVYVDEPFLLALSVQSGETAPVFVGHFTRRTDGQYRLRRPIRSRWVWARRCSWPISNRNE